MLGCHLPLELRALDGHLAHLTTQTNQLGGSVGGQLPVHLKLLELRPDHLGLQGRAGPALLGLGGIRSHDVHVPLQAHEPGGHRGFRGGEGLEDRALGHLRLLLGVLPVPLRGEEEVVPGTKAAQLRAGGVGPLLQIRGGVGTLLELLGQRSVSVLFSLLLGQVLHHHEHLQGGQRGGRLPSQLGRPRQLPRGVVAPSVQSRRYACAELAEQCRIRIHHLLTGCGSIRWDGKSASAEQLVQQHLNPGSALFATAFCIGGLGGEHSPAPVRQMSHGPLHPVHGGLAQALPQSV
mmetsp:Transcript_91180/g.244138  ORF Transcript_91180/g.244138 Transcript_91180/m.244138 type:complete len:292 (-) Transcript_91180:776-1651(-)